MKVVNKKMWINFDFRIASYFFVLMNLAFYIHELLFRYPCVIVPDFGAFLTETYSAQLHANEQSIYPPGKKVFFNAYIQNNDGLLVQYLVQKKLGTTDEAIGLIKNTVVSWKKDLANGLPLELKNIGTFTLNDQNAMVFEPNAFNYAKSSFGLTSAKAIKSKLILQEVENIISEQPIIEETPKEENPVLTSPIFKVETEEKTIPINNTTFRNLGKYAAILVVGLGISGYFGWNYHQQYVKDQTLMVEQKVQEAYENKIQEATFSLENWNQPLVVEVDKAKENPTEIELSGLTFHIVGGAFKNLNNANRAVKEYQKLGFTARLGRPNKFGLTPALYGSYASEKEAINALRGIQQNHNPEAWLLVQKM